MKSLLIFICLGLSIPAFGDGEGGRPSPTPATPAEQQPAPPKVIEPVFSKKRAEDVLQSVNTMVRETGTKQKEIAVGLRSALDVRLPIILDACDVKMSYEILRIAYGVVTDAPESVKVLRDLASDLSRREMSDYKGVTPDCAVALKGLGVAVTKVYLGDKWDNK